MDFKGITWVGNVYQKFEAMCLEVEEIIVQDTAKYVDHQVQTVGNSVKKFCSDVVQDLLPDESVGSGKPLPVSMLHEYAPVCSFKKKKVSVNQKTRDVKHEEEVNEGKKDGCEMKLRGLDADDYDICTSPRQYIYGGPYRRTRLGRKQIFKKEELFQVTRPYIQKDSRSVSKVHNARVKDDVGTVNSSTLSMVRSARIKDDVGTVNSSTLSMVHSARIKDDVEIVNSSDSPSGEVERFISKQECQKEDRTKNQHGARIKDDVRTVNSSDSTPGEVERLISKQECQKDDRTKNQHGLTVANSARNQDSEIRTENEHGLTVVESVRSQDSETEPSVATSLPAGSDDCTKETNEDSTETSLSSVSEQKSEILQHLNGRSVEESCILVDRDELNCVFPDKATDKHKPHKKIRDAISSRMKQNREKEYKRLALQWYAEDVENGRECDDNPKPLEENRSSEESEWEFL